MALLNCASKTLFVGNLHASLEDTDLLDIFKQFGRIVECCKRWCHYGFIQFSSEEEAKQAYLSLNGSKVRGRPMRIEFQRKKIRQLQALFDSKSEQLQQQQQTLNENINQCNFNQFSEHDEAIDVFNEKNIEKFFDDLMDDTNKLPQQQTKPLGCLDLNTSHVKILPSQRKLKIHLSLDKENIENQTKKTSKAYSPESNFMSPVSVNSPSISKKSFSSSSSTTSSSVMLFRSINNSHTICVEPTDVLEPLNDGDFNEYKLFPNTSMTTNVASIEKMKFQNDLNKILQDLQQNQSNQIHVLTGGDYTPQSMSSMSCSSASSMHSSISNSPTNFIHF